MWTIFEFIFLTVQIVWIWKLNETSYVMCTALEICLSGNSSFLLQNFNEKFDNKKSFPVAYLYNAIALYFMYKDINDSINATIQTPRTSIKLQRSTLTENDVSNDHFFIL